MALDTVNQKIIPRLLTGLTATGAGQTTAYQLVNNAEHEFTTVASSTGCVLPAPYPSPPSTVSIFNGGANTLDIYPQLGGTINGGTVNAAITLGAGVGVTLWASSLTNWYHLVTPASGLGSGTVTSVTFTGDGTLFSTTPSAAVITTGSLAPTLDTQSANQVLAGPTTGAAADPTFRALVVADLPAVSSHYVLANTTSGSAAPAGVTLTSLLDAAIASTEGDILYRGASAWLALAPGSSGQFLQTAGAAAVPLWASATGAGTVNAGTATQGAYYATSTTAVSGTSVWTLDANSCFNLPGASVSTLANGALGSDSGQNCLYTYQAGIKQNLGGQIGWITVAGTALADSNTATSLLASCTQAGVWTIPANRIVAGTRIRLVYWGAFTGNGTLFSTFRPITFGTGTSSSNVLGIGSVTPPSYTGTFQVEAEVLCLTSGGSGTATGRASIKFGNAGTNASSTYQNNALITSGVDTTASHLIDQETIWSTSSAGTSIQVTGGYLELVG